MSDTNDLEKSLSSPTPTVSRGNRSASNTVIGPTLVIRGKLKSDEDLVVRGRIEADITTTKSLFVETSGIVKANVVVKSVRISGVLKGNIIAQEKVEIAPDGRVVGDIWSPRFVIADGGAFRGKIDFELPAGVELPKSTSGSSDWDRGASDSTAISPPPEPAMAADGGSADTAPTWRRPMGKKR